MMRSHFICIGEQRCGTTWLYNMLQKHPQVWLPPLKSTGFFTRANDYPIVLSMIWDQQVGQRRRLKRVLSQWTKKRLDIHWYLKYYCMPRNNHWYQLLFEPDLDQISGEFCHQYSGMNLVQVQEIRANYPNFKFIYMMREPISRSWSGLARTLARTNKFINLNSDIDELKEKIVQNDVLSKSRYIDVLEKWWQNYPQEQIFIIYHEQICREPTELLNNLCSWLGLDLYDWSKLVEVNTKMASATYPPIFPEIRTYLVEELRQPTKLLYKKLSNSYIKSWLNNMT